MATSLPGILTPDRSPLQGGFRTVPFEPDHLHRMRHRWPNIGIPPEIVENAGVLYAQGFARSIIVNDEVIASGGAVPLWKGVAEAWVMGSSDLPRFARHFHEAILRYRDWVFEKMNLHRLQCACHADFATSRRWLERLGFEYEGPMPGFAADGSDYVRYAIVRKPCQPS